jgi:hypothetical protein
MNGSLSSHAYLLTSSADLLMMTLSALLISYCLFHTVDAFSNNEIQFKREKKLNCKSRESFTRLFGLIFCKSVALLKFVRIN